MRLLIHAVILSCAALTTLAAQDQPPARVEPSSDAPPGKVLEWTSPEGKPYWYRLPRKIDRARPPNLLLMLHGTGLKWGWAFWNYPIADGSFRGNDIVVAPEGMTDGGGGTFNFVQGKADGDHIAGIIGFFKKRLPVGKVYIYGHSQGAFFSYWFAGEHPELVDGIVAHAGNVLGNVKHSKAAKEKVGIGILHGRADAVVPVDCAYATEKIYKEQGYKKLKLHVVDGLTEQSGHWPLPKQAGEMLAWLDQVSADSPRAAMAVALGELRNETPDLAVVVSSAATAERLLKSAKPEDKALLAEQQAAVSALVAEVAAKHAAALAQRPDSRKPEAPHGPWGAHFRAINRELDALPAWQSAMKDLRQRAAAHEKPIAAGIAKLEKTQGAAFAEAVKALEAAFLAPGYDDLFARLTRISAAPPKGVRQEEIARFKTLADARKADADQGFQTAATISHEVVDPFRKQHPTWFESQ